MIDKKALILVNTGSPDSPALPDVYRYLTEFLNDPYVISISAPLRFILVNLIIIPFRVRKSSGLYKRLHGDEDFPLKKYMIGLVSEMNKLSGPGTEVYGLMRYGKPSLRAFMKNFRSSDYSSITVIPLFPQYAKASSGSVSNLVNRMLKKQTSGTDIRIISQFYRHSSFIRLFSEQIRGFKPGNYEHLVFSYHSLPLSHIDGSHPGKDINMCSCESEMPAHGSLCYKAACYESTRLIASELGLEAGSYSTAFQSRLSRGWLAPFTEDLIRDLARSGKKRILVTAPSFVADCLETLVEIGEDYRDLFRKEGGEDLVLVTSLNDKEEWAKALFDIAVQEDYSSA